MNSQLPPRILYALGCALVLSVHSLTPRSTFAQPAREGTVTAAAPSARDAHAAEHTVSVESPSAGPPRAPQHAGKITSPSADPRATEHIAEVANANAGEHTREVVSRSTTSARAAEQTEVAAPSARRAQTTSDEALGASGTGVVNLNTATAAELERLPRIGPARSQAILALRAKVTRFSKVEQLLRVKGIGRATFRKLRPMLALEGPTTLPERRAR